MAPDFRIAAACWLGLFSTLITAFYIPGATARLQTLLVRCCPWTGYADPVSAGYSITTYRDDANIPLLVNKIYSDNTQLQYAYFDLPFVCPPTGNKRGSSAFGSGHSVPLNLGEILRGDRIMTSDFEINMGQDVECQYLCDRQVGRA